MKFRTKPETVDAIQLLDDDQTIAMTMRFAFGGELADHEDELVTEAIRDHGGIYIPHGDEGLALVPFGYWLIKRADGELDYMAIKDFCHKFVPILTNAC